jgi:hypothetical protein
LPSQITILRCAEYKDSGSEIAKTKLGEPNESQFVYTPHKRVLFANIGSFAVAMLALASQRRSGAPRSSSAFD